MFSARTPSDLTPNRLTAALAAARAAGRPVIDLTESNPTRAGFAYPAGLLDPLADSRALTYAPSPFGLAEARRAVAQQYARRGAAVSPDRIVLTSSTSEAYSFAFKLLADPGDEVLVPQPSYPLFEHLASLDGVVARPYELDTLRGWRIDFDSVERALTARTRAILLVSPNNPTGSFVTADEGVGLGRLAAGRGAALIVDEVFADYPLRDAPARSAACLLHRDDVLSLSLGGLSKCVGLPQVKLAWLTAGGPPRIVEAALARLEVIADTYLSVSTPVQVAVGVLLDRGEAVRRQIADRIASNHRRLLDRARSCAACRVPGSEGGWYAVVEVPACDSEEALVLGLLDAEGVLVHPGYFFDFPRGSHVVISLLPREALFADGLERLMRHIACCADAHD
jgi:aspartate/methionine/tyrosine aminotransferase